MAEAKCTFFDFILSASDSAGRHVVNGFEAVVALLLSQFLENCGVSFRLLEQTQGL